MVNWCTVPEKVTYRGEKVTYRGGCPTQKETKTGKKTEVKETQNKQVQSEIKMLFAFWLDILKIIC